MIISKISMLSVVSTLLTFSVSPSTAADTTIRITGTDGETASVFLDADNGKWAGTNGPKGDLLKARSGIYKSGTNVVPGFAVKGTGLFVGNDEKQVEAFFYNLIPAETAVVTGDAHLFGTTKTGKWTRR